VDGRNQRFLRLGAVPQKWVTSWTGSVQGSFPIGNAAAQPDLRFAFPSLETGARYQSFRLIVRPDLWGRKVRLRFSNALGTRPLTFDGVHVGLQRTAAALVPGSNQPISFAGKERDYGRDVLSLSGIAAVVWLEGINDFSKNGNAPVEAVEAGMKDVVGRIRAKFAGIRIIGATLTSALGSTNPNHGSPEQDAKRKALNEFIRNGGLFDGVADFDAATLDPQTGGMRAEFVPESTTGGPGDKIHPNRVGYLAMGSAIDLNLLAPIPVTRR